MKQGFFKSLISILLILIPHTTSTLAEKHLSAIKVGVILPLSGPVAAVGQSIQHSIEFADGELDKDNRVKFIFEDDQFQTKNAVASAGKLIAQDEVQALITFAGSSSFAVSQIAEKRNVPMIAITPLTQVSEGKENIYTISIPTINQIELLTSSIKQRNFRRVALVTTTQDALLQFRKLFLEQNSKLTVFDEEVLPGDIDLMTLVSKIQLQKPDVVMNFTLPPQISTLARNLRDHGFKGTIMGAPPMYNPPEIAIARGALSGALLAGPKSGKSMGFLSDYFKRYNEVCISEGLYGYDAAALLITASKSDDLAKFISDLKSFSGIAGEYPKNSLNQFEVPVELKEISGDGAVVTAQYSKS